MACSDCNPCGVVVKAAAATPVAIMCNLAETLGCAQHVLLVMDANCNPLWAVMEVCAGVPSGETSYFGMDGVAVDPDLPIRLDCSEGSSPVVREAHRVVLVGAGTWTAPAGAQSVTFVVVELGGGVAVTTVDGVSPMFAGESATWSVAKSNDEDLDGGVLSVETEAGATLAINWVE